MVENNVSPPLLKVTDLNVSFSQKSEGIFGKSQPVKAVNSVSFSIERGETFGIVGESGSGKSTTALAIMQLVQAESGSILFDGQELCGLSAQALTKIRKDFQFIFQDPYSSLNPRTRIGAIVREPMDVMNLHSPQDRDEKARELLAKVGLRPDQFNLFPHQFSGGQRQRVGIARALASGPKLVLCDEPVSALDVAIQAQVLNLLRTLQTELKLTYLFISHDLGVVQYMCDRIAVMYMGRIVEVGDRISLFKSPKHPYTKSLLAAVPSMKMMGRKGRTVRAAPDVPKDAGGTTGCHYAAQCPFVHEACRSVVPQMRPTSSDGHMVACHLDD